MLLAKYKRLIIEREIANKFCQMICQALEINISKFQFDREFEGHGFVSYLYCYVLPSLTKVDLFIYFICFN